MPQPSAFNLHSLMFPEIRDAVMPECLEEPGHNATGTAAIV
jgi:hypothetical protein